MLRKYDLIRFKIKYNFQINNKNIKIMGDASESVNLIGKEISSMNNFKGSVRSLFFEFLYVMLKDDEMSKIINELLVLL